MLQPEIIVIDWVVEREAVNGGMLNGAVDVIK
jgi:hypothetical protein